jgi:FMN reductase (NADPH)/FMN reductase [NAD(P)H]
MEEAVNPTLELIEARRSTRSYDPVPPTGEEKATVLHAALRAPTAGNQMLYSIVEVADQALKDRLAVLCDDQPFIARSPWVLVFLADWQKWMDLFGVAGVDGMPGVPQGVTPGPGDFLMACSDALIAAQTAVLAAESLGIGSCYIGDVLENGETVAELLRLPRYAAPVAMLCFGRPKVHGRPTPHYEKHVVHRDAYGRLGEDELREALGELDRLHAPRGYRDGIANTAQDVYARKFTAEFSVEMNRSAAWWLRRWTDGE